MAEDDGHWAPRLTLDHLPLQDRRPDVARAGWEAMDLSAALHDGTPVGMEDTERLGAIDLGTKRVYLDSLGRD